MEGLKRKVIARMQNRMGPPLLQPVYDVLKLFGKKANNSLGNENPFYKITPFLTFVVALAIFMIIPLGIISFKYDFIFLIYLLVLESALFVLAGFASNNPYSAIASMRELILIVCYEMIFAIIIITVFVFTGGLVTSGFSSSLLLLQLPIAFICLLGVSAVEIRIAPYDTVEAHTEVLESIETEYSGTSLAFLKMAHSLKTTFFAFVIGYFFIASSWVAIALIPFIILAFAFIRAIKGRYRVDQTFKRLTFFLILAVFEFIRIKFIIW